MRLNRTLLSVLFFAFVLAIGTSTATGVVYADNLSETIDEQLKLLDFTEITNYINSLNLNIDIDFYAMIKNILSGKNNLDFNNVLTFICSIIQSNIKEIMPLFLSIIAICVLCSITNGLKSSLLSDSVYKTILFVSFLCILLLIFNEIIVFYQKTKIVIKTLTNLTEIMSPIISVLMIASGGVGAAKFFTPSVLFLTNGFMTIIGGAVMPLIALQGIFSCMSNFSENIKLNKISDFFTSLIKWILGLSTGIYGLFMTLQGVATSNFDAVTFKIAKYTISNSLPIIGGFLSSGFDIVVAGSALIKNAVGITGIVFILYIILSPVLYMASFSLIIKLTSGIIEPLDNINTCNLLGAFTKTLSYLIVCILSVGLMFFITIMFAVLSANIYI